MTVYARGFNPVTGINEKVLWVVPRRARRRAGSSLRLVWRLGDRRVVQRFSQAGAWNGRTARIYPSILRPPVPGCWSLGLRTGRITARMRVDVVPQPRA